MDMAVTELALIQRIRRRLQNTSERLRKTRGGRARMYVGLYYVIDINLKTSVWHHVDIEQFSRELGVLQRDESVVRADG